MVECLRKSIGQDPFFGEKPSPSPHMLDLYLILMNGLAVQWTAVLWQCQCCRHAHDGVSAGAVGKAHGCSWSQPVHIPLRGHHQPWKPHQGDKREWHEGEKLTMHSERQNNVSFTIKSYRLRDIMKMYNVSLDVIKFTCSVELFLKMLSEKSISVKLY